MFGVLQVKGTIIMMKVQTSPIYRNHTLNQQNHVQYEASVAPARAVADTHTHRHYEYCNLAPAWARLTRVFKSPYVHVTCSITAGWCWGSAGGSCCRWRCGSCGFTAGAIYIGADVNSSKDEDGYTPLAAGCASGSTELVKLLIERGADVDMRADILEEEEESAFTTPLCMALLEGREEVAVLLIEHGADVNTVCAEFKGEEVTGSGFTGVDILG